LSQDEEMRILLSSQLDEMSVRWCFGVANAIGHLQNVILLPVGKRGPSVGNFTVTTHQRIGGSGQGAATVQIVVSACAMGNGLNESRQAASSQDLYRMVSHGSGMWRCGGPGVRPAVSANYSTYQ
jgi:hypothetical protein